MAPSTIGGVGIPSAAAGKKKARKPYTITRPRERWTDDEHDRFLHALQLFGRDWKKIEAFVGTKTAVQIRSHAQKHFLKAHKFGLQALCLPPPLQPHRAAALPLQQQRPAVLSTSNDAATLPMRSYMGCSTSPSAQPDASPDEAIDHSRLPLSPDDPRFAQVYRFVGDVFGSGAARPVNTNLHRLQRMDPIVVETILMVLSNLEAKLHV